MSEIWLQRYRKALPAAVRSAYSLVLCGEVECHQANRHLIRVEVGLKGFVSIQDMMQAIDTHYQEVHGDT